MRQLLWWFPFVVSAYEHSGNTLPLPPTADVAPTPAASPSPPRPTNMPTGAVESPSTKRPD
jgi:hypothetical protein